MHPQWGVAREKVLNTNQRELRLSLINPNINQKLTKIPIKVRKKVKTRIKDRKTTSMTPNISLRRITTTNLISQKITTG
jgi:hypothetical protein